MSPTNQYQKQVCFVVGFTVLQQTLVYGCDFGDLEYRPLPANTDDDEDKDGAKAARCSAFASTWMRSSSKFSDNSNERHKGRPDRLAY